MSLKFLVLFVWSVVMFASCPSVSCVRVEKKNKTPRRLQMKVKMPDEGPTDDEILVDDIVNGQGDDFTSDMPSTMPSTIPSEMPSKMGMAAPKRI
ncbi:hypothetical protein ACA910_001956 [Epithemia clementina (nom. ined.)]